MKIQSFLFGIAQVLASVNGVTNGTLCRTSLDSTKKYYLSGDDIIISCTSMDSSVNAKDLFFRHKDRQFLSPSSVVNSTTVELLVKNAPKKDGGTYQCYHGNCTLSVHSWKTILVGDLPQQPDNFECISFNFFNMSCSWRSNDTITSWKLQYNIFNKSLEWKCCPSYPKPNGACDFLSSSWCDFPRYPDFIQDEDYQMILSGKNVFGLKMWSYTVNAGPQIVKLNPVEINYAEASKVNELNISWKASKPYFENSTCLVSWNSQWDTFWESKLLNFASHIVKMSTTISNLRSYTYYTVNISCRWFSSKHWSEATVVRNKTRPTAPDRAPDITNGSFTEVANCTEKKTSCLYIYWKEVPIWEWNAPNLIYNIKLHDRNYNVVETNVSGNQSLAEFVLKDDVRKPYKISISSYNDNGFSRNINTVEVHEDIVPPDKVIVERNVSNHGINYLVTWIARSFQNQAISRVTYFWALCCFMCREICPPSDVTSIHWEDVDTHNESKWSDVETHNDSKWRDIDTQIDSKWINLTNTEINYWHFGVSIETWNSVKTAISWSDCVFPYDGQYNDVPEIQTRALNYTFVEILLLVRFCNSKMRPFVYQVFFSKSMPSENDTDTQTEVRNFTATPWLQSFLLDGLETNTEYLISLAIIGRFFRSKQSKEYRVKTGVMMTHLPTDVNARTVQELIHAWEGIRIKPSNNPKLDTKYGIIIGITVSIIIVMLGFLFRIYMHRTCKEKCRGPPIDVPHTAWLNVPNIIEVSDGKVTSKELEDDNANHSYVETRAMISDINRMVRGLNRGPACEDGQCGHVVVGSNDDILFSLSTTYQNEFRSDQKLELSTLPKNGEMPRSCTNIYDPHFPCQDLKDEERGSSGHSSMDVESWKHLNLNKSREHEVHSYVSATNLISRQLMDVSVDDRATILVKDEMSESSEIRFDVKAKCYVDKKEYEKDDENSATQIRRTANENIKMKESVSNNREEVNGMYHSTLNNETKLYVTVNDICDTERHVTTIDTCGTPSIDSYMLTLPSGSPFVMSSNVEQEKHKNSYIRNVGDEVEDITNSLQE